MTQSRDLPTIDRISSDLPSYADSRLRDFFDDQMKHDNFRSKVKEIINEASESVPFMKKIKEYASEEIDTRIFKGLGFWVTTIVVPIIVSVIASLVISYLKP